MQIQVHFFAKLKFCARDKENSRSGSASTGHSIQVKNKIRTEGNRQLPHNKKEAKIRIIFAYVRKIAYLCGVNSAKQEQYKIL